MSGKGPARDKIVEELKKYVREAQAVTVTLRSVESQKIWILGRLNKPGVYELLGSNDFAQIRVRSGKHAAPCIATKERILSPSFSPRTRRPAR